MVADCSTDVDYWDGNGYWIERKGGTTKAIARGLIPGSRNFVDVPAREIDPAGLPTSVMRALFEFIKAGGMPSRDSVSTGEKFLKSLPPKSRPPKSLARVVRR
jgi:hypothetical protein